MQFLIIQGVCGCILSSSFPIEQATDFPISLLWYLACACVLLCVPGKRGKDKKQGCFKKGFYVSKCTWAYVCQAGIQGS